VLPNLPAETHFEMRTADLRVIADTIRWTSETTGEKVSVLGASFGGGLAVAAALQPSVAQDVKLIFSLSGYYNLHSIARFYIHDQVYDPNGHPYSGEPPGPLLILAQYLDELVPPNELKRLEAEMIVLKRNQGFQFTDRDPSVADLTQTERHDLNQLQTVDTPEIHQRYMDILERHREDIAAMSPSGVVKGLNVPLYVLHGQDDRVLPEGDIEWMRKVLQGNPNAHILVTPWIGHAVIGQPATVRQKLDVARFGAEILRGISRSVSLH
jgi:pimeloyl-ACP methyl ester carboxylesterase